MGSNNETFNRASSLPPSCLEYENRICELNLSLDAPSTQGSHHTTGEMHKAMNVLTGCARSANSHNGTDPAEFILHSVKVSPSDSSGITDEDSGYFQTNSNSSRQVGSSVSIATSGQTNYDSSAGFINRDELLQVMTEDLVDWFIQMYPTQTEDLTVDNFFDRLSDGVLLCYHVTELHQRLSENCEVSIKGGRAYLEGVRVGGSKVMLPSRCPVYQTRGLNSSNATSAFVSRDNVANFLSWCRQLGMPDSVLFESEDLVCRKNPRNVAVCLLELARLGGGVGMAVPELIQLEVEIDEELACDCYDDSLSEQSRHAHSSSCSSITDQDHTIYLRRKSEGGQRFECTMVDGSLGDGISLDDEKTKSQAYRTTRSTELRRLKNKRLQNASRKAELTNGKHNEDAIKKKPELQRPVVDMRSLDEIVRDLLSQCTCKQTFPMIRVSEGRYLFGDKCTQIFVRILRNHVMVRVGGGWDTLNHFLTKYDECRKINPPNYRVVSETCCNPTTPRAVDTTDPETILSILNETDTAAPLPQSSPIRGQGKVSAIKKSPSLEESAAAQQLQNRCNNALHGPASSTERNTCIREKNLQPGKLEYQMMRPNTGKTDALNDTQKSTKTTTNSADRGKLDNAKNGGANKASAGVSKTDNSQQTHRSTTSREMANRASPVEVTSRDRTQATPTINRGTASSNRHKLPSTMMNKRSGTSQRALASAPRTPCNRSRAASPSRLNSILSKSSSSLTSCGLQLKNSDFKGSVPKYASQTGHRFSEQPNLMSGNRVVRANASKTRTSESNGHLKVAKQLKATSTFPISPTANATVEMSNKNKYNQSQNSSDLVLHKDARNRTVGQENITSSGSHVPPDRQEQLSAPQMLRTVRRPSLIPRLIRFDSPSRVTSANSGECNIFKDL